MKKLVAMIGALALAAVVYFIGCGMINRATAIKPDFELKLVEQPTFTNTVRSW